MQLEIGKPILDKNDRIAEENRELLDANGVFMLNILASPGSGKTSTILATIEALRDKYSFAVIEGDLASKVDSEKIKAAGIPCVQINTGGICHLESQMIANALAAFDLASIDILLVENVGNLVCTTDFYLGENARIVILSVPEGHDKPVKYPIIFQDANAVILNKVDVIDYFDFNERDFRSSLSQLNPAAPIFPISATKGTGVKAWTGWLDSVVTETRG